MYFVWWGYQCTKIIRGIFINYVIKKRVEVSFSSVSQIVIPNLFLYIKISVLVKIGKPVTILAASSWSCFGFCEFPIPQLSHICISQAYSKSGLKYTIYLLSKLVRLRRYFSLRRMFKCLDTLFWILLIWVFHFACWGHGPWQIHKFDLGQGWRKFYSQTTTY